MNEKKESVVVGYFEKLDGFHLMPGKYLYLEINIFLPNFMVNNHI